MPKYLSAILIGLGLLIGVALLLNWDYVVLRAKYGFKYNNTQDLPSENVSQMGQPDFVRIPSLQIKAPIKFVKEKKESVYQEALAHGVVHFPDTALAGQSGNMYIFGHSSDLPWSEGEYKTVFALLPQIKIGAEIFITDSQGREYKYKAVSTKVVPPNDLSVLNQYNNEKKLLTLQTSYPIGTALKRYIVVAELVE